MRALTAIPPWQAQYEGLYRAHSARVGRLCRLLLNDPQEAEEVAQEVFVKLAQAYPGADRTMAWGLWLTRVAVNACHDRRRSTWWQWRRLRGGGIEDVEVADRGPTPERAALSEEARGQIWTVFRQLPRRQREVFILRHLEGCSTQEAAEALGLTPGSVKRHLFRAVHQLRKGLGGNS